MITAAEAITHILANVPRMPEERVPLTRALGYILAENVVASTTHPPWRNASMDGYAICADDLAQVPQQLRVIERVAAGQFPTRPVGAGEATRITTGAPVPEGADSVIRIEDTDGGTETVEIQNARDRYHNVRPQGEDFRAGDLLLPAGAEVTPAAMGVLAAAGCETVCVYRRPMVAIVSSGDELVLLDQFDAVRNGQRIVSSNSYTLPALVRDAGGVPCDFGIAADTPDALRQRIESARGCDLLVTSAGISVGDHDYTRDVLQTLGADIKFWKVRIRPGAPLAFGTIDGTPWIGLSGNPVSAMVTFELFVRPAIRQMCGHAALFPTTIPVRVQEPITTNAPLTHFLRVVLTPDEAGYSARLTGTQSSGVLTSMAKANALLVVPYDRQQISAGEVLQAIPLGSSLLHSATFPA